MFCGSLHLEVVLVRSDLQRDLFRTAKHFVYGLTGVATVAQNLSLQKKISEVREFPKRGIFKDLMVRGGDLRSPFCDQLALAAKRNIYQVETVRFRFNLLHRNNKPHKQRVIDHRSFLCLFA